MHYSFDMKKQLLIALLAAQTLQADELSNALKNSSIFGYTKAMYVADDRKPPKLDQNTPGFGGKVGLESGSFFGVKTKAAWYTTTDFGTRDKNPKKVDAYMFDLDKTPYSIVGEANIAYSKAKTTFTFGRQEIDTPIISTYDYRIIPNLFEAYTLTNNDIDDTTITLSYVTRMSGLDGLVTFSKFRSMSQQTYTSLMPSSDNKSIDTSNDPIDISKLVGENGVYMTGIVYEKNQKIQLYNYYCPDVLNTFYTDAAYVQNINANLKLTLEAQFYSVKDVGKFGDFLKTMGLNGSYELYGAKGSLADKTLGVSASLAYNKFTGNDKTVTAFGNWGGYPEFVAMPYMFAQDNKASAIAGSQMGRAALTLDPTPLGIKNQTLTIGYSMFDLDKTVLDNSDITMLNFLYKNKITKNASARLLYEMRNSKNYRYDNDTLSVSLRYDF